MIQYTNIVSAVWFVVDDIAVVASRRKLDPDSLWPGLVLLKFRHSDITDLLQ
jgi:hypothetical protein